MIRWVGNEKGVAPYPCWSTVETGTAADGTEEGRFSGNPGGGLWMPGECDVPVRNHEWFWNPGQEHLCYSVSELMDMYYRSVGRNCNLLLNANPGPNGLVPDADFERYRAFGREIQRRFSSPLGTAQGEGDVIDLDLGAAKRINHVSIMEDIGYGERILRYVVEAYSQDSTWRPVCYGESVGHRRLQQFATIETARIRLNVTGAKGRPMTRQLSVHHVV
jgi:alpha-L-fucosidase